MKETLSFRKAKTIDLDLFYSWRNEDAVINCSFEKKRVSLEEHTSWFTSKLNDKNCQMYVVLVNMIPAGQARFDINSEEAIISISLDKAFRGRSIGYEVIKALSVTLIREDKIKKIIALIKPENKASIGAFTRAGYRLDCETEYKGQKTKKLVFEG